MPDIFCEMLSKSSAKRRRRSRLALEPALAGGVFFADTSSFLRASATIVDMTGLWPPPFVRCFDATGLLMSACCARRFELIAQGRYGRLQLLDFVVRGAHRGLDTALLVLALKLQRVAQR